MFRGYTFSTEYDRSMMQTRDLIYQQTHKYVCFRQIVTLPNQEVMRFTGMSYLRNALRKRFRDDIFTTKIYLDYETPMRTTVSSKYYPNDKCASSTDFFE